MSKDGWIDGAVMIGNCRLRIRLGDFGQFMHTSTIIRGRQISEKLLVGWVDTVRDCAACDGGIASIPDNTTLKRYNVFINLPHLIHLIEKRILASG